MWLSRHGFHPCLLLLLCLLSACNDVRGHQEFENQEWTKDFAVELNGDRVEADLVMRTNGFKVVREIPQLKVFHVHHPGACTHKHVCKRHAEDLVGILKKHPTVKRVEQQFVLERDKRGFVSPELEARDLELSRTAIDDAVVNDEEDEEYKREVIERHERMKFDYNDPLFKRQWHLDNYGQIANPGLDLNILPAWRKGYMGQGSRVTVVDDGVDTEHKDLHHAYDPLLSADLDDPTHVSVNPRGPHKEMNEDNTHGTQCAGEIAAQPNNSMCGAGVASRIRLGGVRILAGKVTDLLEAFAVLHQHNKTEVYSCSWGPKDNGKKMEMPHYYTAKAIRISATRGRNGLGNLFAFASGNGGGNGDNCGADGYVNTPHVFPMAAVNIFGRSVFYGERCSGIMAAVPVGGRTARDMPQPEHRASARIITTNINNKCSTRFAGTSAAAPLGAACMSLILQANRKLTWRDVQHIIALATRIPSDKENVWQRNGAGYHVSHHFGFGLLDCSKAIKIAQKWSNIGPRRSCHFRVFKGRDGIYMHRARRYTFYQSNCTTPGVGSIEHVTVKLKINHKLRGDLEIWLISPMGTVSRLLGTRWMDRSAKGVHFIFLTRMALGESPKGKWTLEIRDKGRRKTRGRRRGTVHLVEVKTYGTATVPKHMEGRTRGRAYRMTMKQIREAYQAGRKEALGTLPEHKDVLKLKKKLLASSEKLSKEQRRELLSEANALLKNRDVSTEEMKSVVELLQRRRQGEAVEDSA